MSAATELAAVREELERLFPAGGVAMITLAPALAELERALAAGDRGLAWASLDLLEDLLEARMHEAGWPSATPSPSVQPAASSKRGAQPR